MLRLLTITQQYINLIFRHSLETYFSSTPHHFLKLIKFIITYGPFPLVELEWFARVPVGAGALEHPRRY